VSRAAWEARYRSGDLPWDTGRADLHLTRLVEGRPLGPCRALEIGCGTGTDACWLAGRGFDVTAVDIAPTAVSMAREKARSASCEVSFVVGDFLETELGGAPFRLAYDRGCFHVFETDAERAALARNVSRHLGAGGLWLSLVGSADGPPHEGGPPRRSARDIVLAVETLFEVLSLEADRFDLGATEGPPAWVCLLRRREAPRGPT
jgi:SAM-dependent methyltransferase